MMNGPVTVPGVSYPEFKKLEKNFEDHGHTADDIGAAPKNHSHTAEDVGAAPKYTYGAEDLTAGVSELETGKLHFVYE